MRAISIREDWGGDRKEEWDDLGIEVVKFNESADYEENETALYNKDGKYTLLAANGCSCWDGEWEGWTDLTIEELKKLGDSWAKDWGQAEKKIGEYIQGTF